MPSRVEGFLAHLDRITGGVEPLFLSVPRSASKLPEVTVMAYQGLPEDVLTAVTYGVSFARHAEWRHGSAELCLSVRSADLAWAHALGALAEACREVCPFTYGTLIDFGQRVSAESSMTAFAVFSPLVLERADYLGIDLAGPGAGTADLVNLHGVYPIHESERKYAAESGLRALFALDWDPCDVRRDPVV